MWLNIHSIQLNKLPTQIANIRGMHSEITTKLQIVIKFLLTVDCIMIKHSPSHHLFAPGSASSDEAAGAPSKPLT